MLKTGFAPIVDGQPKVLILGSMPGEASLDQQQYYAHPRNLFWEFMGTLLGFDPQCDYAQKCRQLTHHRVALWDVIQQCKRPGSLDSAISSQSIVANNFKELLANYPSIQYVFFNGLKAENEFRKRVTATLPEQTLASLSLVSLPSTSPANQTINKAQKLKRWRAISIALE